METAAGTPSWLARWTLPLVLAAVLLDAGAWWLADFLIHPQADFWERVMFRPGGDITYLPYIRALADLNLGEPADFATRGQGSWTFPWLQLTPFSLLLRVFGPAGFMLADLLFQVGRWWLLYRILLLLRVERVPALGLAALVSALSAWLIAPFIAPAVLTELAMDRLPRPYSTDLILLGLLWCLLKALGSPPGRIPLGPLAGAAALVGLTPHGDYHGLFSLAPLYGCACLWLLWRERRGWPRAAGTLALASLPAAALGAYWLFLVGGSSAEITRRLGAYDRPRLAWPAPWEVYDQRALVYWLVGVVILGGLALLTWRFRRLPGRLVVAAGVALALVFVAPWVSLLVAGKFIQVYQFGQRLAILEYFVLAPLLAACWPWKSYWRALPIGGMALLLGLTARSAMFCAERETPYWVVQALPPEVTRVSRYRTDFRELERVLARPAQADARVLATLDPLVNSWWLAASGRSVYLPDPFATRQPDAEVEDRLLRVGNLCGTPNVLFITNTLTSFYFHSHAKYQFSPATRFRPDLPLTPVERETMRGTHFNQTWTLVPPAPEIIRMELRRRELAAQPQDYPFDLLILSRFYDGYFGEPDPRLFRKVLENPSFRVYRKAPP
jgi:hypothetical protein